MRPRSPIFELLVLSGGWEPLRSLAQDTGRSYVRWRKHVISLGEHISPSLSITVVDLDGDGDLDIVVTGKWGGPAYLENTTQAAAAMNKVLAVAQSPHLREQAERKQSDQDR